MGHKTISICVYYSLVVLFPAIVYAATPAGGGASSSSVEFLSPVQKLILTFKDKNYPYMLITPRSPVSLQITGPTTLFLDLRINLDPKSTPQSLATAGPFTVTAVEDDKISRRFVITGTTLSQARYKDISVFIPSAGHSFRIDVKEGPHSYTISLSGNAAKGGAVYVYHRPPVSVGGPKITTKVIKEKRRGVFFFSPHVGYGQDYEERAGSASYMKGGLDLRGILPNHIGFRAQASGSFYSQTYVYPDRTLNVVSTKSTGEQKISVDIDGGYVFEASPAFSIFPSLGYKGIYFMSKDFASSITGLKAGLGLEIRLSRLLSLDASGDFVYSLMSTDFTPSRLGLPSLGSGYSAGIAYRFSPSYLLKLGYEGEVIHFTEGNRFYNGASLAFAFIRGGTPAPVIVEATAPVPPPLPTVLPPPLAPPRQVSPPPTAGVKATEPAQKAALGPAPKPAAAPAPPPVPEKKPRAYIEKKKIVITETVHFETGKARILPDSFSLLDEVARVMKDNPNISVRIEGHTDNVGKAEMNLQLSQARADSVMKYLVSKGVSPNRLAARGYGGTIPLVENATPEGRAKNRRVEFTIIKE